MITSTTQTAGMKPNDADCNLRATTDTLPQPSVSYSYGVTEGKKAGMIIRPTYITFFYMKCDINVIDKADLEVQQLPDQSVSV